MKEVEYDELTEGEVYFLYFKQDTGVNIMYIGKIVSINATSIEITSYYGASTNGKYDEDFADLKPEGSPCDLHYDPTSLSDLTATAFLKLDDDEITYQVLAAVV